MKKIKGILPIALLLILSLTVLSVLIKGKTPKNIFSFLDIGTYRIPPASVEVNSSKIYGQSFVSNFDNLFMMSIFIPKQNLKREGQLYFHLKNDKDDPNDIVMLKWKFDQINFLENNFYIVPPDRESTEEGFHFHFQFPPIRHSKSEEFYFYFESPDAREGEGIKLGVWDNRQYYEALTKGTLFINHRPMKGFLAFRTYDTWTGNISILINEIKTRLLKDRPFLVFYCASLVMIISVTITVWVKTKNI